MLQETTAPAPETAPATSEDRLVIEGRFGTLAVHPDSAIRFPNGLLGFGEYRTYALALLDDARFAGFHALQSLEEPGLAFLVTPLDVEHGPVAPEDLAAACKVLGIPMSDLAALLVVTIRRRGGEASVSANLRAPLLIDSARRTGVQFVLPNDGYPTRFPLR